MRADGQFGAVACGHEVTRDAAAAVLREGGNAFDAVAAALWASCVAEPILASPGGGGFLLARPASGAARVYDFFAHTPHHQLPPGEADFREILADFGTTTQAFHIGLGASATPGVVAGLFAFQQALGRMPVRDTMAPAIEAARTGVTVNPMQGYLCHVVAPILLDSPAARALFAPTGQVAVEGDCHRPVELGDFLEVLAAEGPALFYQGEVAAAVEAASRDVGGHLRRSDFEQYEVVQRKPLAVDYRGHRIWTNPPPASGGALVAFGLQMLAQDKPPSDPMGPGAAAGIARVLAATGQARVGEGVDAGIDEPLARHLLDPATVVRYRNAVRNHPPAPRGTTHISVIDVAGNAAALTVSNGEGCGWMVPGTGFMLNNMLGEADLLPRGFGTWPVDRRMTSMMAPTLVDDGADSYLVALGSGGSNRIRSALLQVLSGVLDYGMPLDAAVERPRLHVEGRRLEIEGGWPEPAAQALADAWAEHCLWPDRNLFFGGAHAVAITPDGFAGAGDPRRGGCAVIV